MHRHHTPSTLPRRHVLGLALASLGLPAARAQTPGVFDDTWADPVRGRELPLRIRFPAPDTPVPAPGRAVVLFSHGLGGTRAGGAVWGEAWAAAGFVVVHLQHPGSDLEGLRAGLRRAASPQQLLDRLEDVRFVLDEIDRRRRSGEAAWATTRAGSVGLSGHSFGAHTTLGMAGQAWPGWPPVDEPRLAAFVTMSPALPRAGDARTAFAAIRRPLLCLTGTRDGDVIGNGSTPERRAAVFDALPPGHKAQLVLQDADHMSFAGQPLETGARRLKLLRQAPVTRELLPRHHALIATLTTDWWRAHLLGDDAARERLAQPAGLAAGDLWQRG